MNESVLAETFGRYECEAQPGTWVQFRTSGYPFKLRKQWRDVFKEAEVLEFVLKYVADWSLKTVDGTPVVLPPAPGERKAALVDDVENVVVAWLVSIFGTWLMGDSVRPPKNSSPPSRTSSSTTAGSPTS